MLGPNEVSCSYCNTIITNGETRVRSKIPLRKGDNPEDYRHYHNRQKGDCWFKYLRDEVMKRKTTYDLIQAT